MMHARAALVDTGYTTHALKTLSRRRCSVLGERSLDLIVNTHRHPPHCGGNAATQAAWPCRSGDSRRTSGRSAELARGAPEVSPPFPRGSNFSLALTPGEQLTLGAVDWQVLGAPGHDP